MSAETVVKSYEVVLDDYSVWQQGNMRTGDTYLGTNPDGWETNLLVALVNLGRFTTANQVVRVSPSHNPVDLIDFDAFPEAATIGAPVRTEGVITSNPFHVIFANPEDCGEIAVSGSDQDGKPVIGLFHASRHQVDRQVYIQSLDYLCESRGIEPEALSVKLSPSARAESYAFPDIAESQKASPRWQGYVQQDNQGLWHVDFHNLMLDDLRSFGIKDEQMVVSSGDTAHPESDYYSYSQYVKGQREDGGNSLLFALR